MASPTEENYLKALFSLSIETGTITVSDLGLRLNVSIPTVNSMIKKLHDQGLVVYEKYRPITLTSKGKKEAALVIRKHRLTEMYLVEKMGFGWEQVHEIAEQMEHIDSPMLFQRMDELLGRPTIDPHGSPIPDDKGRVEWKSYEKLSECKTGSSVRLAALTHSSREFLGLLNDRGLSLGMQIKINHIEAFDGSMTVSYKNHNSVTLSALVCERLLVE
jgi:DtxR family Mn-dependent transcriptional regulator